VALSDVHLAILEAERRLAAVDPKHVELLQESDERVREALRPVRLAMSRVDENEIIPSLRALRGEVGEQYELELRITMPYRGDNRLNSARPALLQRQARVLALLNILLEEPVPGGKAE